MVVGIILRDAIECGVRVFELIYKRHDTHFGWQHRINE